MLSSPLWPAQKHRTFSFYFHFIEIATGGCWLPRQTAQMQSVPVFSGAALPGGAQFRKQEKHGFWKLSESCLPWF